MSNPREVSFCSLFFVSGPLLPELGRGLTLGEAYRISLEESEGLQVFRERKQQARDNVVVARSRLYPELTIFGEAVRQKELSSSFGGTAGGPTFQPEENYTDEVEYRHRLYHGGKTWFGWSLRSQEARQESFRHYRRRQEVLFNVARRYYEVPISRRNLEIARKALERSRNQLDVARQRPGLALGRDTVTEEVEGVSFDSVEKKLGHYYTAAFENRWDLKQARAGRQAAAERVKWERADYFPSLDLVSQYRDADEPRFSEGTENWSVRLVGSYPLFWGWLESAEIDQARSQYDAANAQFDHIKKEIRVNIRSLYLDLESQRKVIETAENEVESARENYHLGILRLRLASGTFKQELLTKNLES